MSNLQQNLGTVASISIQTIGGTAIQAQIILPEPPKPKVPPKSTYCSCVVYAKALTGYTAPVGAARNWPVNSLVPHVGDVVVMNIGPYGHTAVITAVYDGKIDIVEANFLSCTVTHRTLSAYDKDITGFWHLNLPN